MRCSSLLIALLATLSEASPILGNHVLHEKRDASNNRWIKRNTMPSHATLPLRIGLHQSNLEAGHERLMAVSDMDHPEYSNHMTAEEVIDFFAPPQAAVDAVYAWLTAAGIAADRIGQSVNKQWIQLDASVEEAEDLFKTKYYVYEHSRTGNSNIGCDEYHVPASVQGYVDYVTPGLKMMPGKITPRKKAELEKRGFRTDSSSKFDGPIIESVLKKISSLVDVPGANLTTAQKLAMCDTIIYPECIARMYNITKATLSNPNNKLGIFEEGDYYGAADLALFFTSLAPYIPSTTVPVLNGIDGGTAPLPQTTAGAESDLDFQISYPIIYPQNTVLYQTDDYPYATGLQPGNDGAFNTFYDAIDGSYCTYSAFGETGDSPLDPPYPDPNPAGYKGKTQCGVYKPTNVISVSYGLQEDDLPTNYQQRQCAEVMKLGLQGVTVVFASGDSGVSARGTDDGNSDGCLGTGQVFNPDFPASCPYITAVGATYLPKGANVNTDAEVAVTRFPSGGGFSNIFPRPSYQTVAVRKYLVSYAPKYPYYTLDTPTNNPTAAQYGNGLYNRAGRGYPDVSAVGDNVLIINNGAPTLIGGTSASAPVFAAIINRINEERLAVGKKPVGFVNPTLYANPSAFHDITVGSNPGCNTQGFTASTGWDPVTGLGTPNYPALLSVFLAAK